MDPDDNVVSNFFFGRLNKLLKLLNNNNKLKRDDYGCLGLAINIIHASTIVEACKMGLTSLHDSFGS